MTGKNKILMFMKIGSADLEDDKLGKQILQFEIGGNSESPSQTVLADPALMKSIFACCACPHTPRVFGHRATQLPANISS